MLDKEGKLYARKVTTACIAVAHTSMFLLATNGHLGITVPSQYDLLVTLVNNYIWLWINLVIAILLFISLVFDRWHIATLSVSSGFMGAWGFFTLLGAFTAASAVSFTGPVLAIILAVLGHTVAVSWATVPERRTEE